MIVRGRHISIEFEIENYRGGRSLGSVFPPEAESYFEFRLLSNSLNTRWYRIILPEGTTVQNLFGTIRDLEIVRNFVRDLVLPPENLATNSNFFTEQFQERSPDRLRLSRDFFSW